MSHPHTTAPAHPGRRVSGARVRALALGVTAVIALAACQETDPTPSPPTTEAPVDDTTTTTEAPVEDDTSTTTEAPVDDTTTTTEAPSTTTPAPAAWPEATSEETVADTIEISGSFDGGLTRYVAGGSLGDGDQSEGQGPVFRLADGATLENVVLGSPAADGIHCDGECTLRNVWWEDVGEDAATFRAEDPAAEMLVDGGGARYASDKVFQHNGTGTVTIRDFEVEDFGKLYRSCGTCDGLERHVVVESVTAIAPGLAIVGINPANGDTATLSDITIVGDEDMDVCQRYDGTSRTGAGPDATSCLYDDTDITRAENARPSREPSLG